MTIGQRDPLNTSMQATGRLSWPRYDEYPWRVIVLAGFADGSWIVWEVFEWETENGAHAAGLESIAQPVLGAVAMHYYVGEVA